MKWHRLDFAALLAVAAAASCTQILGFDKDFKEVEAGATGSGGTGGSGCADGTVEDCYSGPAGTQDVGACKVGTRTCTAGVWSACTGEVLPASEICNPAGQMLIDENCDGVLEEGCVCAPGQTMGCYTGTPGTENAGACHAGTMTCNPMGTGYDACTGEVVPAVEVCNNIVGEMPVDEDCNGMANEVCAYIAVAAGEVHSLALRGDGTVWAWGQNVYGQLAVDPTMMPNSKTPIQAPGIHSAVAIAAGQWHSVALLSDGTVRAWGSNSDGQLGIGSMVDSWQPVAVKDLDNATAVAGRNLHSLAIRADGSVWAWGDDAWGQLGDGSSPVDQVNPVPVAAPLTGTPSPAVSISGGQHSLAALNNGKLYGWGKGDLGQLCDGAMTSYPTPAPITNISGIIAVAAGNAYSLLLTNNSKVWGCGANGSGQLGNGTTMASPTPVQAMFGLNAVTAIAAGQNHSLAIAIPSEQSVWGWGRNTNGQVGHGDTIVHTVPVAVYTDPFLQLQLKGATRIAAGQEHSLAVSNGRVWAWGKNDFGQLGYDTPPPNIYSSIATQVPLP